MATHVERPAEAPAEKSAYSRPRTRALAAGGVILLILIAAGLYLFYRNRESTDDAEIEAHIDPIAPRVAGTVVAVDVLDNDRVQAGQVLFQLDDRDYRLALEHAQADLASARAAASGATTGVPIVRTNTGSQISSAQAGLNQAQAAEQQTREQLAQADSRVVAAQATLAEAQANAQKAASDRQRYAQLAAKDEVSQEQFEAISTAATAAAASARAAAAELAAARNQVAADAAGIRVAQGRVEAASAVVRASLSGPQQVRVSRATAGAAQARVALAEAEVAQAQLNLDWTVVRAPVAGIVGDKHLEVGQSFSAGQPALSLVESGRPLQDRWVEADFKETQLQAMRPGQRADVHVDAYGENLKARIDSLGAGTGSEFSLLPPENATGNYVKVVQRVPIKLYFLGGQESQLQRLRPGMSVEVTVFTK